MLSSHMCLELLFFAVISPGCCFKVEKTRQLAKTIDPRAEKCVNWLSDARKFSLNENKDIFLIAHKFWREIAQALNKDETF